MARCQLVQIRVFGLASMKHMEGGKSKQDVQEIRMAKRHLNQTVILVACIALCMVDERGEVVVSGSGLPVMKKTQIVDVQRAVFWGRTGVGGWTVEAARRSQPLTLTAQWMNLVALSQSVNRDNAAPKGGQ